MKRLQFRKENKPFESRDLALKFFDSITNVNSAKFGESLFAEPMVVRYIDEDGAMQVILAIGVDSGNTPYHLIDSAKIEKDVYLNHIDIINNALAIDKERDERIDADKDLQAQITKNMLHIERLPEDEYAANVRDEYALKNAEGVELEDSDRIKVYKDSALVDAQLAPKGAIVEEDENGNPVLHFTDKDNASEEASVDYLYLIYRNENGKLTYVSIDYEKYLHEAEFKDGLIVSEKDHTVSVKIDSSSEKYLTVSPNGVKISGIDEKFEELENLKEQVTENKLYSKDVVLTTEKTGTTLDVQVDGKTIVKTLNYENGISVFSSPLKIKEVEPSSAAYKAAYQLQNANGEAMGTTIEIAKESSLSTVGIGKLGDEIDTVTGNYTKRGTGNDTLNFIYLKADGSYELVAVEVSKYFTDAHFGKGFNNQDGIVSLLEGDGNEYLVIGEDTIAVIGVNEAIAKAKSETNKYTDDKVAEEAEAREKDVETLSGTIDTVKDDLNLEKLARSEADNIISGIVTSEINRLDTSIEKLTEKVDNDKVIDVDYNSEAKLIRLKKANGDYTEGFDVSDFLIDSVLSSVSLDEANNTLVFVWDDKASTTISVPLTKFVDTYESTNDFIKIDNYKVTAIVDGDTGLANTLASTDYVKESVSKSIEDTKEYVDNEIKDFIKENAILTDGLPVNDITIEEAEKHSLLREVLINGKSHYYAINEADKMLFVMPDGTKTNLNAYIAGFDKKLEDMDEKMSQKMEALEGRVTTAIANMEAKVNTQLGEMDKKIGELTEMINTLNKNFNQNVKDVVKNYIVGTSREIMITNDLSNDKLKIGFTDDAIFGYIAND